MIKDNKILIGYIIGAYLFGFMMHLYWINWASGISQFFWNGQLMINNVDGYFYGSGAQKIIDGMHMDNPRLLGVYGYGTAVITAYIHKFFPFLSLDTIMLYLPAVISSIVVIPIILISKLYNKLEWGFLAALIGSIGWSYYNRTLAGYYDTDMFSAMLPMFILYFILASIKNKSLIFTLIASFVVIVYPWLYDQGLSIVYAMGILAFLYLVLFDRNEEFSYKFITIFAVALMPMNIFIKILLIIGIYLFFNTKKIEFKYLQIIAGISFLGFFITGNIFNVILAKIVSYSTATTTEDGLKFLNVNTTVSEASHIPWDVVFDRIIGSSIGIVIAVVGYLLLIKKYKEFIIALPLWGIGFFAFVGGLRFTVYAVPIAAISAVYFFIYISQNLDKTKKYIVLGIGSLFVLLPNITHIVGCCEKSDLFSSIKKIYPLKSNPYLVPTTFNKSEVAVLDKLKQKSNPKDYVITWWDYGYPIWYYANVNTLVDGGKHNQDNFIASKIITTSNQTLAYNLAKVTIKKYVDTNKTVAPQIFTKNNKPIDVSDYLAQLSNKNFKSPKLNRDIYLMFPYRMFNILPTINVFSNRDLNTGNVYKNHYFIKGRYFRKGNYLIIKNIALDLKKAILKLGKYEIPLKALDIVKYDKKGQLQVKQEKIRNNGWHVILLESYKEAIVVDDYYYNSMFIQMFVFQHYDKKLFEPVILNPMMKIYKLK